MDKFYEHPSYIGLVKDGWKEDERFPIWEEQFKERGFDNSSLWNLDLSIVDFIVPRLREFIKVREGIFVDEDNVIPRLKEMLECFETAGDGSGDKVGRGFQLLAEMHPRLWY